MTRTAVTRCAAVASHGRRCQQTPYQGSGYCWHHLRSQKLHRPSTPLARRGRAPDQRIPRPEPAEVISATRIRLDRLLGPERVRELLAFLEGDGDGSLTFRRRDGVLGPAELRPAERPPRATA